MHIAKKYQISGAAASYKLRGCSPTSECSLIVIIKMPIVLQFHK